MQDFGVQTHQMQRGTLDSESQDDTHTIEEATAAHTKTLLQLPSAAEIAQHEVAYLKFTCTSGPNDPFFYFSCTGEARIHEMRRLW